MESTNLIPALRELPGDAYQTRSSFREMVGDLVNNDRAMFAAEFTSATSFGLWAIFDTINVDDNLGIAYALQYPGLHADHSLHQHMQEMMERGPDSVQGFMSGLKGKVAELNAKDTLEQSGYTNVAIAQDPTQPGWDISAVDPAGETVLVQVKTGSAEYAGDVMTAMESNPDVPFAVSSEIYDSIAESAPELTERLTDIGSDHQLVEGIEDGLDTLSSNLGIDVPDGMVDIIPYAGAIIAGARLIYGALQTEQQFKAADRTTLNKIQVVQALTLMSRMGVSTTLAAVGGMSGAAVGSGVPLVGNLVGGVAGTVAGAGMGMYLNSHLQPHMLDLALDITGLDHDDLFYYKNKEQADQLASSFRESAKAIAVAPAP